MLYAVEEKVALVNECTITGDRETVVLRDVVVS
jgi:hypothetical protein